MRITSSWDSDNFDMDLWVTDPNGEKCYYGNTSTKMGAKYTYDNMVGYGPEEVLLKDAIAGDYKVEMNYYGTRSQKMLAPVTVTIDFFTNYGLQSEEKQSIVLRLGEKKKWFMEEQSHLTLSNLTQIRVSVSQNARRKLY